MTKPKPHLAARLWQYQKERSPIVALTIMAAVTVGLIARFSDASLVRYFLSVVIALLYLIQIRTSDEQKDFEHDNQFYPERPVQRGLVSLSELAAIGRYCIAAQIVLYLSFRDWRILAFGALSLGYGYLCRKEFFVRPWIRRHFFFYTFVHYVQLIFLFGAIVAIMQPSGWAQVLIFTLLNVAVVELGRKNKPRSQDQAGDTYSSHLGYPGTALGVTIAVLINLAYEAKWFAGLGGHTVWLALPVLSAAYAIWQGWRFGRNPTAKNQVQLENSVLINFTACMFAAFVGLK